MPAICFCRPFCTRCLEDNRGTKYEFLLGEHYGFVRTWRKVTSVTYSYDILSHSNVLRMASECLANVLRMSYESHFSEICVSLGTCQVQCFVNMKNSESGNFQISVCPYTIKCWIPRFMASQGNNCEKNWPAGLSLSLSLALSLSLFFWMHK